MKPLHANWFIHLYNELSSPGAKDVIIGRWKKSGIYDAIKLGSSDLPSIDPFAEIEPMDSNDTTKFDMEPVSNNSEYMTQLKKRI